MKEQLPKSAELTTQPTAADIDQAALVVAEDDRLDHYYPHRRGSSPLPRTPESIEASVQREAELIAEQRATTPDGSGQPL